MLDIFRKKPDTPKLIMTSTQELFIPTRLYYKLHNIKALIKALRRLKCVLFHEEDANHFIISYYKEAKKINLGVSYQQVPKELYPVTLADGYIRDSELHIDTKSLARAVELIDFLAKSINPSGVMEITAIAHLNKASTAANEDEYYEWCNKNYDELFNNIEITDHNIGLLESVKKIKDSYNDESESVEDEDSKDRDWDKITAALKQQEIENYPDVEKIALHYHFSAHKDMIDMLRFRALIKEAIATRRYEGKKNFN